MDIPATASGCHQPDQGIQYWQRYAFGKRMQEWGVRTPYGLWAIAKIKPVCESRGSSGSGTSWTGVFQTHAEARRP